MAGIGITTGFASTYGNEGSSIASAESIAADLSFKCFVTMAYNWRGHGPVDPDLRPFFFHDETVRTDLVLIASALQNHLAPGEPDQVNDAYLGMLGFSQAGNVIWQMMAHQSTRGLFTVMVPWDGITPSQEWMTPNNCILAALGNHVDLRNKRDAGETDGVTWDATAWSDLSVPYLAPNVTTLRNTLDARDGLDELAQSYGGIPFAHLYGQSSWYDVGLSADEIMAGYAILSPDSGSGVFPYHRLLVSPDAGHNDEAWAGTMSMRADRRNSRIGWLITHLPPAETPAPNPTATPQAVELFVDYYDPNMPGPPNPPAPQYYKRGGTEWPPGGTTDLTLYFNADGKLTQLAPTLTVASDNIGQTFDNSTYNATAAVAESPHYATWNMHITGLDSHTYESPILAQDVILVSPPEATLYTNADTGETYHVNVRISEELSGGTTAFVTRVNACRWDAADINGTTFSGISRVHEFQEGSRIVVTLSPVDQEEYYRSRQKLAFMPVFGTFLIDVFRQQGSASRIGLELLKSEAGDIFEPGTLQGQGQAAPEVAVPGTPVPTPAPEPLAMETLVWPERTNPGNWHAWAPEVWFDCTGGQGEVSCPATAYLTTDGVNQSFTFTATDAASNTVPITLTGFNIDRTAPVLAESLPESQTFCTGSTLTLDYDVSDALSGLGSLNTTFNGLPVSDGTVAALLAGANTLHVEAGDVAGNLALRDAVVQVDYDETLAFPPDGGNVNPAEPLTFEFKVNDACTPGGNYGGATGTLWLTGPDGVEIAAEWFGLPTGNEFTYNALTGWYTFDADLTGLATGSWAARAHLDDGNDYTVTFVIPGGLGGEAAEDATTTVVRPLCQDGWLRPLLGAGQCR